MDWVEAIRPDSAIIESASTHGVATRSKTATWKTEKQECTDNIYKKKNRKKPKNEKFSFQAEINNSKSYNLNK